MSNPYEPTPPDESAKALQELKTFPSLEDTKAQLQKAIESIKASAEERIPNIVWTEHDKGAKAGCFKPYDQSDGQSLYLPNAVADNIVISEDDWTAMLTAARNAASQLGALNSQVMQDQPGNHDVRFYGAAGIALGIGFQKSLVITGYTGCRLPAVKK